MFSGNLINDLIATVERVEQRAEVSTNDVALAEQAIICESFIADGLIVLAQQNGEYDSALFWQQSGVA